MRANARKVWISDTRTVKLSALDVCCIGAGGPGAAFITDLDGGEAATLGPVLARVSAALRAATAADKVYVYVFGDRVAHLHFNLAPHTPDSPLLGGRALLQADAPPLDRAVHQRVAATVADPLAL